MVLVVIVGNFDLIPANVPCSLHLVTKNKKLHILLESGKIRPTRPPVENFTGHELERESIRDSFSADGGREYAKRLRC